tara:strand:+ start:447 stop:785 length:339 start_codon:yes stop_codon:yes gene_type:complete
MAPTAAQYMAARAAEDGKLEVLRWLVDVGGVTLDGKMLLVSKGQTREFLESKNCPVWPKKKERVTVPSPYFSSKAEYHGILIGIDGYYGIVKMVANSDIKIVPMNTLVLIGA